MINEGKDEIKLAINVVSFVLNVFRVLATVSNSTEYTLSSKPGKMLFKNGNLFLRLSTLSNAFERKLFSFDKLSRMLFVIKPSCLIP